MSEDKVKEIEEKIADLKARWPPHSVPPSMWQQLEELEEELEEAKRSSTQKDERPTGTPGHEERKR
jgi:hypothetical protein